MDSQTFLFYDLETTGLNKAFDQVLQFAAIRTDKELNELERHEILIRLSPDVVPSPKAVLTHQITPSSTLTGETEINAIIQIHQLMNIPGTVSIGYNTLGFDDEFLRFSFYRNLLPPYTHQYANHCSRADLYPMLAMFFLYKKTILNWPEFNNKISLKLEHLNQANDLTSGAAHNAMVDVTATLALAKHCYQEKEMWNYLLQYFDKNTALQRITKLTPAFNIQQQIFTEGLLIDGSFGSDNFFQCPVLLLGQHRHYKNKTVWLRLDKPELTETTTNNIAENAWAYYRKPGEDSLLLPITEHYTQYLKPERQSLIEKNKQWLLTNSDLLQEIVQYHLEYKYPKVPNLDVDAALYENGFLSDYEQHLCKKFHAAAPENKHRIIDQFQNMNCQEQAIRILGRNFPEHLPTQYSEIYSDYLAQINAKKDTDALIDYRGEKRLTPQKALEEIAVLRQTELNENQLRLLVDLEMYLQKSFN